MSSQVDGILYGYRRQIFEMVHMMTYQRSFVSRYSRISSILETDTIMAQHAHREVRGGAVLADMGREVNGDVL